MLGKGKMIDGVTSKENLSFKEVSQSQSQSQRDLQWFLWGIIVQVLGKTEKKRQNEDTAMHVLKV